MKRKYAGASSSSASQSAYKAPRRVYVQRGGYTTVSIPRSMPVAQPIRYNQTHIGGEVKSVDVLGPAGGGTYAPFLCNATASIVALNLITAGSSMWNRIGRKVSMKSVYLRGYFGVTGNNNLAEQQFVRITILYDKQPNGALPNISDIFQDQANSATDSHNTSPNSGINLNNRDRFEVLADEERLLSGGNTSTGATASMTATADPMHLEMFRKLKGRETHYKADSTPGVIGDIATGSLILVTQGASTAGNEPWQLNANIRVRYSDL